jgi:hypothetical protein
MTRLIKKPGHEQIKAILLGTGTKKRQQALSLAGEMFTCDMKKSGSRYLVYINDKWIGELPTVAAKYFVNAESSGMELKIKTAKILKMPTIMADLRKAAFEVFDTADSLSQDMMLGVFVVVEARAVQLEASL